MIRALLYILILPFIAGAVGRPRSLAEQYFKGSMLLMADFGACYYIVLFGMRTNSLQILIKVNHIVLAPIIVLAIIRIVRGRREIRQMCMQVVSTILQNKSASIIALVIIGYQMLRLGIANPSQIRDNLTYDHLVTNIWETGLVYGPEGSSVFDPAELTSILNKYITTPWYPYEAYLAKLCGCHPLIITRTIIPVYMTIVTYIALWLLGVELFSNRKEKAWVFIIVCGLLYEGRVILGEQAAYMLVWPQWGKNLASSITCTIMAAWFLQLVRCYLNQPREVMWLFLFSFVGTTTTAATMMAIPLEMGTLALVFAIRERKLQPILIGIIGTMPCILQFLFYVIYRKGLLNNWLLGA